MSNITITQVQAIAALARLSITETEAREVTQKLDQVLGNFSRIQTIDTTGTPPADDVTGLSNVQRDDVAWPAVLCSQAALLAAAPATANGHIKVKAVF